MFEIVDSQVTGPIIKVIGVGGAGGNAVNHMIEEGVAQMHHGRLSRQSGSVGAVLGRMREWFQRNF